MIRDPYRLVRTIGPAVLAITLVAGCSGPASDGGPEALAAASLGPDVIALPDGFRPEGVVAGRGTELFAGSLADGSIVRVDLRTGSVDVAVPPQADRIAVGLAFDVRSSLIWVAGGPSPSGHGYAYDASTGAPLTAFAFGGGFVNDVVVTRSAAWFTDSFAPMLYRVPLDASGRPLGGFEAVPLGGDFVSQPGFNANGIAATPDGSTLFVVHSELGAIYAVDPASGVADEIDLGGEAVPSGDGLLLDGRILYVVQNALNQIAAVRLSPDLTSGEVIARITSADFDVPTTVAGFGPSLYAVNARFGTPPTASTSYDVVRVDKVSSAR